MSMFMKFQALVMIAALFANTAFSMVVFAENTGIDYARFYYDYVLRLNLDGTMPLEADMADLDGDGAPELVLVREMIANGRLDENGVKHWYYSSLSRYTIEIYKYINNQVTLMDTKTDDDDLFDFYGEDQGGRIYIVTYKGRDFICVDGGGAAGSSIFDITRFLAVNQSGKIYEELRLDKNVHTNYNDKPDGTFEEVKTMEFLQNGGVISENEYNAIINQVTTRGDIEDITIALIGLSEGYIPNPTFGRRLIAYMKPIVQPKYDPAISYEKIYNNFIVDEILTRYNLPSDSFITTLDTFGSEGYFGRNSLITAQLKDMNNDKIPELVLLRHSASIPTNQWHDDIPKMSLEIYTCANNKVVKLDSKHLDCLTLDTGVYGYGYTDVSFYDLNDIGAGPGIGIYVDNGDGQRRNRSLYKLGDKGIERILALYEYAIAIDPALSGRIINNITNKENPAGSYIAYIGAHGFFVYIHHGAGWQMDTTAEYRELDDYITEDIRPNDSAMTPIASIVVESAPLDDYDPNITLSLTADNSLLQNARPSVVEFDFGKMNSAPSRQDIFTVFETQLSELDAVDKSSDDVMKSLAEYISFAIQKYGQSGYSAQENQFTLTGSMLSDAAKQTEEGKTGLLEILKQHGITLNKAIETVATLNVKDLNVSSPLRIKVDASVSKEKDRLSSDYYSIVFDGGTVKLNKSDMLDILSRLREFVIQIETKAQGLYSVIFMDSDNKVIDDIGANVYVQLPCASEFASVFATYKGGGGIWGGQFDSVSNTIEFATKYSGEYSIEDNLLEISDISGFDEDIQQVVSFMVSKGFFTLDDGKFNPDAKMKRAHIVVALTRMFFTQDTSAKTTFTDVSEDDPLYLFVASAQKANILKGITETEFGGEGVLTKAQLISLCARTLREKRGYTLISDPNEYLRNLSDRTDIPDWAEADIALAIREGFTPQTGEFLPNDEISRVWAAIYLHKLYTMLYEVQPAVMGFEDEETESVPETEAVPELDDDAKENPLLPFILGGAAVVGIGAGVYIVISRKNKITDVSDNPSAEKGE